MSSRVLRRRSATAAWIYVAVACGIVGTDRRRARPRPRATSACSRRRSSAVGFFQIAPRSHRRGVADEVRLPLRRRAGLGPVATPLPADAPAQARRRHARDADPRRTRAVRRRDLRRRRCRAGASRGRAAPARAVVRERRGDGAAAAQPLRPARASTRPARPALRLLAIVIAAPMGVTEALVAIVVAQAISTIVISVVGVVALRRFPSAPAEGARRGRAAASARS